MLEPTKTLRRYRTKCVSMTEFDSCAQGIRLSEPEWPKAALECLSLPGTNGWGTYRVQLEQSNIQEMEVRVRPICAGRS